MNINSSNIRVYPTASRSPDIDYCSNLNIEQNIVALSNNITDYNSYIINGLDLTVISKDNNYFCALNFGKFICHGYDVSLIDTENLSYVLSESYTISMINSSLTPTIPPGGNAFEGKRASFGAASESFLINGTLNTPKSRILYDNNIYVYNIDWGCYVFSKVFSYPSGPNNQVIFFEIADDTSGAIKLSNSFIVIDSQGSELDTNNTNYIYATINIQPILVSDTQVTLYRIDGIDNIDGTYTGLTLNVSTQKPTGKYALLLGEIIYNSENHEWNIIQASKNVKFNAEKVQVELDKNSGLVEENYSGSFKNLLEDYLIVDDGKVEN